MRCRPVFFGCHFSSGLTSRTPLTRAHIIRSRQKSNNIHRCQNYRLGPGPWTRPSPCPFTWPRSFRTCPSTRPSTGQCLRCPAGWKRRKNRYENFQSVRHVGAQSHKHTREARPQFRFSWARAPLPAKRRQVLRVVLCGPHDPWIADRVSGAFLGGLSDCFDGHFLFTTNKPPPPPPTYLHTRLIRRFAPRGGSLWTPPVANDDDANSGTPLPFQEHHLQRAICAGLIIPTPEVFETECEFYDRSYPNTYKMPRQMIHMQRK